jgi:hypothetical protein
MLKMNRMDIGMNDSDLREVFARIAQSGSTEFPAYTILLEDYWNFHFVSVILVALSLCAMGAITGLVWARLLRKQHNQHDSLLGFERRAYILFSVTGSIVTLIMLVFFIANLGTVIAPQYGFLQTVPETSATIIEERPAGFNKAIKDWVESGSPQMPAILQQAVDERLSWQKPKAAICITLFIILAVGTTLLWQRLIQRSRNDVGLAGRKWQIITGFAVLALPIIFLLWLMAIANTQASIAPIMISLFLR